MEHWDLLPGVDPKIYLYNRCGLQPCRYVCFTKKSLRLCQVEEDDQTNILQGKLRLQLLGLLPWWQTEHAFGVAQLFELTHCLARIHPFFQTVQADQPGPRLPDAPCAEQVLLPQGRRLVFSRTGKRATKKKKKREEEIEEGKTFRSERTVNFGPKSQRFLNQSLRPFPFLCAFFEQASTSPKLGFALCLYLDKLSLHRATPQRFWLSKTDLKTAL